MHTSFTRPTALAAFCGALIASSVVTAQTITGAGTLTGTASASATKADGKTPDPGYTTYSQKYDGPVEFTFDYTINTFDNLFETTASTITFTTVYYSAKRAKTSVKVYKGDVGWTDFTTQQIQITGATFDINHKVQTISFSGPWYPIKDAAKYGLIDTGLTGSIDFTKSTATFTSSYQRGEGGPIATFVTTGTVKGGVTEPSTWALMLFGAGLAGMGLRMARKRRVQVVLTYG